VQRQTLAKTDAEAAASQSPLGSGASHSAIKQFSGVANQEQLLSESTSSWSVKPECSILAVIPVAINHAAYLSPAITAHDHGFAVYC
jgi:hypothetical protein